MVRIALDAGHGVNTPGKRCLKKLDNNETREWILNNRVMVALEKLLKNYEDVEILRVDDRTGIKDVSLEQRVKQANDWEADIYVSNHFNAGVNGGAGGGIIVYASTNASAKSLAYQKALYDELIKTTGLKGNRAKPLGIAQFYVIYRTKMPALLIEGGFMDSKTDVPIILTQAHADKMAQGYLNFLINAFSLKEKRPVFEPFLVEITAEALNVRARPNTSAQVTTLVKKGQVYTIVGQEGNWGKLKSGAGWIYLKHTQKV